MNWRQARKYGVSRVAVIRKTIELARDGKCSDLPDKSLPILILNGILDDQDDDVMSKPGFDIQSLIDLITQLMPFIQMLIAIFGGL